MNPGAAEMTGRDFPYSGAWKEPGHTAGDLKTSALPKNITFADKY